jgi:UDP-N-acetylglucosamine acyltransferase
VAYIHPSVTMGPGVLIGEDVSIEAGCHLGAYSIFEGDTHIGPDNRFFSHTIIGGEPQDHKFRGGGKLVIGSGNTFREFVSVHRGHLTGHGTVIGSNNMFLTGAHVGHDCVIGNQNFLANQILLAGHVEIDSFTNISGGAGVHQFCRIGSYAMISGLSGIRQDVLPYAMVQGDPAMVIGINKVGLSRKGFSAEQIFLIQDSYRRIRQQIEGNASVYWEELQVFIQKSQRGLLKFKKALK